MNTGVIYCTNCGSANETGTKFCYQCGSPIKTPQIEVPQPSSDFITLACPKCGGQLEITPDMDRFACKYCGNEHLVRRSGGNVSLSPVVEGIKRVEDKFDRALIGADRMAAEQTIQRLKNELPAFERDFQEKQAIYATLQKQRIPKPSKSMIPLGIVLILGFFGIGILSGLSYQSRNYELADFLKVIAIISPFVGVLFVIIGAVRNRKSRAMEYQSGHLAKLENARIEMDSARTRLEDQKKRLEDLHRYTTER